MNRKIESKWQKIWDQTSSFKVSEEHDCSKKYYVLEMFPYPSGRVHVGHLRNYAIGDVLARFMRCLGFNVLHPIGWDAFGLPAENAAIANRTHPAEWTYNNISTMREQLKRLGLSYDWSRELITCDPQYYKFEQDFFLQLFEKNLVYRKKAFVNWDPVDRTVLANEQVIDGRGWRSGAIVEKRELDQWFVRITDYADELFYDIEELNLWPDSIKNMQKNWIGRSEGFTLRFSVKGFIDQRIEVFSTRIETIFGISFISISKEHPILNLIEDKEELKNINAFIKKAFTTSDNTKIFSFKTSLQVLHPLIPKKEIPVIISNFVLKEYGTGAVFGAPAHDLRDHKIASEMSLPIVQVIDNSEISLKIDEEPYTEEVGVMINSSFLDGMDVISARNKMSYILESKNIGKKTVKYRIKDWCISRQRYWGAPIPIIYCTKCGTVPVNKSDLPVHLPEDVIIEGNPLQGHPSWKNVKCPKCGKVSVRETDTFDTFFESSWYFLRFCNVDSESMIEDSKASYWLPVDRYIGGIEHAIMHLLYSRFFTKVLKDFGYIKIHEPFRSLLPQGMVLHRSYKDEEGNWILPSYVKKNNEGKLFHKITNQPITEGKIEKMSKSKNNIIDLEESLNLHGADVLRMFVLSDTPIEKDLLWSEESILGIKKFIKKLSSLISKVKKLKEAFLVSQDRAVPINQELEYVLHFTIKNTTDCIKNYQLNNAIAGLRKLFGVIVQELNNTNFNVGQIFESVKILLQLFNPFIPHITEELWQFLGCKSSLVYQMWPEFNNLKLQKNFFVISVQINGKFKFTISVKENLSEEKEVTKQVLSLPQIKKIVIDKKIKNVIYIPNRTINIVI